MLHPYPDTEVLDFEKTLKKFKARKLAGDDTGTSSDPEVLQVKQQEIQEELGQSDKREDMVYTGPLHVTLNHHQLETYNRDILQFKEFIDDKGEQGITFEYLFSRIDAYVEETGDTSLTTEKVKQRFYSINMDNRLTIESIRGIAYFLDTEVGMSSRPFTPMDPEYIDYTANPAPRKPDSPRSKYQGPTTILLTRHSLDSYPDHILQFKELLEKVGRESNTDFNRLFYNTDYYESLNDTKLSVRNLKGRLYQMDNDKFLTLTNMRDILGLMGDTGYNLILTFTPLVNPDKIFTSGKTLEDLL